MTGRAPCRRPRSVPASDGCGRGRRGPLALSGLARGTDDKQQSIT